VNDLTELTPANHPLITLRLPSLLPRDAGLTVRQIM
jgi:hypothetical protein